MKKFFKRFTFWFHRTNSGPSYLCGGFTFAYNPAWENEEESYNDEEGGFTIVCATDFFEIRISTWFNLFVSSFPKWNGYY